MDKLISAGLFGKGLVKIATTQLVSRYNDCLTELGLPTTSLAEFFIDGIGWSPEIAHELGNPNYLSHGINRLGIILTPKQRHKPVYNNFNSYERRLLVAYFDRFSQAIADITVTCGICLDIDSELFKLTNPSDLLMVDYVVVRTMADKLPQAAVEQKAFEAELLADGQAWDNRHLRRKIMKSATEHGDLRFRHVEIPDWRFEDVGCFYTRALGGVFVFRFLPDDTNMLVFETPLEDHKPKIKGTAVYTLADKELLRRLEQTGLIETDLVFYAEHPEVLLEKKECMIAEIICSNSSKIDYRQLNLAQKKGYLEKFSDQVPKTFYELERLIRHLKANRMAEYDSLSYDLRLVLLMPKENLEPEVEETVGQLIARLQPLSLLCAFTWDKNLFFERFQTWPASKQDWAISVILEHYHPKMHQLTEERLVLAGQS